MYSQSTIFALLAVYIMMLGGCVALIPTPIELQPPRAPQVAELKSFAISSIEGKDAEIFKAELQSMLQTEDDKFVFVSSPQTAEGVFSGRVLDSSVRSYTSTNKTKTCERKGLFKACKDGTKREKLTQCLERTAYFKVAISVTKVKTEKVIYSKTITGKDTDRHCSDKSHAAFLNSKLLQSARTKALEEIRKDIAPYETGGELLLFSPKQWFKN
jgi:inosine/xanthosine triphosphate pyrophosphatase family protein